MRFARRLFGGVLCLTLLAFSPALLSPPAAAQLPTVIPGPRAVPAPLPRGFTGDGSGTLQVISKDGKKLECPLKHTDVHATISGYVARVQVKQTFGNPFKEKIEAVYTFPLSDTGAVDEMMMKVGGRTIHGTIKKREEAREIYEQAKNQGHVAALLDEQRANIFTQSVANIEPGKSVEVTLTYVDLLPYQDGEYKFAFPTVVGPRFNPGIATDRSGLGFSANTTDVPDGSKITPHVSPEGLRAGHDLSIDVSIDAGVPITNVHSELHDITVRETDKSHASVSLKDEATIPNKDFVLSWGVSTDKLHSGYLTNGKAGNGYFTLMILPPKKVSSDHIQPKEMIFIIDCSGSQRGKPLQKAKEAMMYSLDHMNAGDTFQVITFNNKVTKLFDRARPATENMRSEAKEFVQQLEANGGTWMAPAVEAACREPADEHRLRIVSFMTDGLIGNDMEVIGLIRKLRDTSRWFPFGTGNSVNRYLIDNIAKEGGGEADYVYLNSDAAAVGKKFYGRIANPVLTDVKVDFDGLAVKEVYPNNVSDVWDEHPLYIIGRYVKAGSGTVTISGYSGGKPYVQKLNVSFPENDSKNAVLGSLWARAKVDRLLSEDYFGAQRGDLNKELKDEIIRVALEHHLLTQFTSFVAVEEKTVTDGGKPKTVEVPVELPDGVSRDGVFGEAGGIRTRRGQANTAMLQGAHQHYMHKTAGLWNQGSSFGAAAAAQPSSAPMATYGYLGSGGAGGGGMAQGNSARMMKPMMTAGKAKSYQPLIAAQKEELASDFNGPTKIDDKAKATAVAKLSDKLRRLAIITPLTVNKFEGIDIRSGRIYVKVKLKKMPGGWLPSLDVNEFVYADRLAYGWVSVSDLVSLSLNENVVSVEAVPPPQN